MRPSFGFVTASTRTSVAISSERVTLTYFLLVICRPAIDEFIARVLKRRIGI